MKYLWFLHLMLTLLIVSCVGSGNRGGGSSSSGNAVSAFDVTLLNESACICKQGGPLTNINGNCYAVCAQKPATNQATLFLDTYLGSNITLNSQLGSLYNWCRAERIVGNTVISNPECVLEVEDSQGQVALLDVTLDQNSQNFSVNVQALSTDETYIINLLETSSGNTSNSIQIRKDSNLNNGALGNLSQTSINRYNCYINKIANDNFVVGFFRLTYLYSVIPPLAIPAGVEGINCHANYLENPFDNPFFPRLELQSNVFSLWSATDPRFYDNDGDGTIDVHDRIIDATNISDANIFQSLSWDREPPQARPEEDEEEESLLGYLMIPFIYPETHPQFPLQSFCPGNDEFNGGDPLFREIRTLIGTESEGLYIGKRDQQVTTDAETGGQVTIPQNLVLLKESVLKQIWFYCDGGISRTPTDQNVRNVTVFFHWPADPNGLNLCNGQSSRETYRLIDGVSGNGGAPTHDKKIGCIPKQL